MKNSTNLNPSAKEDVWIPSVCTMSYSQCAILVHKVNGIVTKIEGNPDSPQSQGRLCPKGVAGLSLLHDPNRINVPLKRTNPQKGRGIDPGWVEITWDEALGTIADRLKKIKDEDPRKFYYQGTTIQSSPHTLGINFCVAFGSPNFWSGGGGAHCGNGAHEVAALTHSSWSVIPDFQYCNYIIYFGASKGHAAGHCANANALLAADARARGARLVVVDPMCNFAANKASEWIPIRVGTDAALALGLANVLLNELGIYDAPYLKTGTNGPYLIGPDKQYVKDTSTGKPLIWDSQDGKAKTFDDPTVKDFALLGSYQVNGLKCTPAFQLIKDHVAKYTPAKVSEITTVAAETVTRIAREFGEAARIGSTIVIDGKELPFRPAAAIFFRGAQGHRNSLYNCIAFELLNEIIGCSDVPGGCLGIPPVSYGHPATGRPYHVPQVAEDGLMKPSFWFRGNLPYPPHDVAPPKSVSLKELFPAVGTPPTMASSDQEELLQKFKVPYRPEVVMSFGCNANMCTGNSQIAENYYKKIPFIFSFSLHLNEFTELADIVLPDTCYLERLFPSSTWPFIFSHPAGPGEWTWAIQQPVVGPQAQRRDFLEVMLDLAYRIGGDLPARYHELVNSYYLISDGYKLARDGKYTWPEVCDRVLKSNFGDDHGLEWFKKNGVISWPKRVEEVYWRVFLKVRVPIYFEWFTKWSQQLKPLAEPAGLKIDYRFYEPLPDWLPCASHDSRSSEHDLYAFYYRDVLHTGTLTQQIPWLDEASRMNPYTYFICLNADTARKKGIKQDDDIYVESATGLKVKGKARLSEGIHPEGVGIAGCAGHWAEGLPIAKGKGVHFNDLMEVDLDHMSPINLNIDTCARVRVYKA